MLGSLRTLAGSALTGTPSVLTAGEASCADCPDNSTSSIPIASKTWTIVNLTGTLQGGFSANQRDMLVQVKDAMIASGHWEVVLSSDGDNVGAPGVDMWPNYQALRGAGGGGAGNSWMQLRDTATGMDLLWCTVVTGPWLELQRSFAPAGTLTGGTVLAPPTAPSQIIYGSPAAFLGQIGGPTDQYYATLWTSSDGQGTRVAWWYAGVVVAWWQFDQLQNSAGGSWTLPCVVVDWSNSKSATPRMDLSQFQQYSGPADKRVLLPPATKGILEATTDNYGGVLAVQSWSPAEWSGKYLWVPPAGFLARWEVAGSNGVAGWTFDQWWTTNTFNDGDTVGDDKSGVIVGGSIVPWDGSTPGAFAPSSVAHPSSDFYGRNVW